MLAGLVIIVLITALAVPGFVSLLATSELRAAARDLRSQLLFARDLAVRESTYSRLIVDEIEGTHRVTVLAPSDETGGASSDREWRDVTDPLGVRRRLPEGIGFARVIASDDSAEPQVTFSPDGRGEAFYVALSGPGDRRLAVQVDGITGQPKVLSLEQAAASEQRALSGEAR